MKAEIAAGEKKFDASVKASQDDFLKQQALLREAHEAKETARKELELRQIA